MPHAAPAAGTPGPVPADLPQRPAGPHPRGARPAGRTARPARRRAAATTVVALAALLVPGTATAHAGTDPARQVLAQVNRARRAHHLRPLAYNRSLSRVAAAWSRHMAAAARLEHNPRLAVDLGSWNAIGENVGYGPSAASVEGAFMRSPHHRANILDRGYTEIGIAVVRDRSGRYWVTQDFRRPRR